MDALTRGVVDVIDAGQLEALLRGSRPVRVKQGFDPSASDLDLGHAVGLRKLRALQDLGHQVVVIVGDFTARIGDPSGRSTTRPRLSAAEVDRNAQTYLRQFFLNRRPPAVPGATPKRMVRRDGAG